MDKQIEEMFEKYKVPMFTYGTNLDGTGRIPITVDVIGINRLTEALRNGDLFTRDMVQKVYDNAKGIAEMESISKIDQARIEGKIEMINEIIGAYENEIKHLAVSGIKLYKLTLETKLKELK